MKKHFLMLLVLGVVAAGFTSCRNGKDDPLISFRSRNTRLIGTWKLNSINNLEVRITSGDTTTITTSLTNGKRMKTTVNKGRGTIIDSVVYAKLMTINSDGTYSLKVTEKTTVTQTGGYWYWLTGDEDKIAIRLGNLEYRLNKLSYSDITMVQSFSTVSSNIVNSTEVPSNSTTTTNEEKYSRQ